jgi:nucleoside-diphosphate-sugar epimerase
MTEFTPRSILVTGGAGFIGSHVARALAAEFPAARVTVLDKLDACASLHNVGG